MLGGWPVVEQTDLVSGTGAKDSTVMEIFKESGATIAVIRNWWQQGSRAWVQFKGTQKQCEVAKSLVQAKIVQVPSDAIGSKADKPSDTPEKTDEQKKRKKQDQEAQVKPPLDKPDQPKKKQKATLTASPPTRSEVPSAGKGGGTASAVSNDAVALALSTPLSGLTAQDVFDLMSSHHKECLQLPQYAKVRAFVLWNESAGWCGAVVAVGRNIPQTLACMNAVVALYHVGSSIRCLFPLSNHPPHSSQVLLDNNVSGATLAQVDTQQH